MIFPSSNFVPLVVFQIFANCPCQSRHDDLARQKPRAPKFPVTASPKTRKACCRGSGRKTVSRKAGNTGSRRLDLMAVLT